MRSFFVSAAAVLLAMFLLYCGLNLAEQNLFDLMGLEHEAAAFTVKRQGCGTILLTFSKKAINLDGSRIQALLEHWLKRLPFTESAR